MALPARLSDKQGRPFVLRRFEERDRHELAAMYDAFEPKRVAQGLPPGDPGQRRRWLDSVLRGGYHILVEVEGRIAGHGMLVPFEPESAELANFLHQSTRDRGIGTALNRALLDEGRAHGIRRVWLSVEPSNRPAIRSYEKVGFRHRLMTVWTPEVEMEVHLDPDQTS